MSKTTAWNLKQRLESKTKTRAPWYCYCMRSATTATTTPSLADAAFLVLPLLLVLVLLGCCFVCTPWPANKDCGPVVVVTGGVLTTKGKNEKTQKYTSSGTRFQIRLQASQNKTRPCMLLCAWPANKDCGPVCCSKATPHNNPHLQTKTAAPCVVPRPPPHNNTHLQTKTAAPCVVPRPPATTTPTCKQRLRPRVLFQGPPATTTSSCKQRLWPRVLFQGPPPQQPPCCCWMVPTNKTGAPCDVLTLHC